MKIRIPLLVFEILILIALIVAVTAPARAELDGAAIPPLNDGELAAILESDPLVFAAPAPVTTAVESMPTATADAIRASLLGR